MTVRVLPYIKILFIRTELKSKFHLISSKKENYPLIQEHVISLEAVSTNERDGLVSL